MQRTRRTFIGKPSHNESLRIGDRVQVVAVPVDDDDAHELVGKTGIIIPVDSTKGGIERNAVLVKMDDDKYETPIAFSRNEIKKTS